MTSCATLSSRRSTPCRCGGWVVVAVCVCVCVCVCVMRGFIFWWCAYQRGAACLRAEHGDADQRSLLSNSSWPRARELLSAQRSPLPATCLCRPLRPQKNGQGNDHGSQYRTGIYWHNEEQQKVGLWDRALLQWASHAAWTCSKLTNGRQAGCLPWWHAWHVTWGSLAARPC